MTGRVHAIMILLLATLLCIEILGGIAAIAMAMLGLFTTVVFKIALDGSIAAALCAVTIGVAGFVRVAWEGWRDTR